MYYLYGKINRGHGICPLLGESVIRGFTIGSNRFSNETSLYLYTDTEQFTKICISLPLLRDLMPPFWLYSRLLGASRSSSCTSFWSPVNCLNASLASVINLPGLSAIAAFPAKRWCNNISIQ